MDETRFDSLRRALVAIAPRRGLMSLLGGLTLSGMLPLVLGSTDGEAKNVHTAKKKKKPGKSKPGPQGPPGAPGAQGPAGSQGPAGPEGPPGPRLTAPIERRSSCRVLANNSELCTARCQTGEFAISGGYLIGDFNMVVSMFGRNASDVTTWEILVKNNNSAQFDFPVMVYCVSSSID